MSRLSRITFAFFLLLPAATLLAQDEATEVDPKYTWDLTEIYPSLEAWEQARDEVLASRGTQGYARQQR
jgi:oligoendopeptidase F